MPPDLRTLLALERTLLARARVSLAFSLLTIALAVLAPPWIPTVVVVTAGVVCAAVALLAALTVIARR